MRRAWLWAVGGCLTVLVFVGLGVGLGAKYGVPYLLSNLKYHTCVPSNFPKYPGASEADDETILNGQTAGWSCHAIFESDDDVASVNAFYASELNTGSWQVGSSGQPAGTVNFQPTNKSTPFGTVQVAVGPDHVEITIDLYTSTCLPQGFPSYSGTTFGGMRANVPGVCHVAWFSSDNVETVIAFYKEKLNGGNWHVTGSSGGLIGFVLKNGKRTLVRGSVTIAVSGDRTQIQVDTG